MWMDEEDAHLDEQDVRILVEKFNSMIKESSNIYFDVEQLEIIVEYYLENGLPKKAMNAVNHGLEMFPKNDFLLLRKGQISVSLGDLKSSKEIFKELLVSDSSNAEILFGLGMIEAQEHSPKKAVSYYKLAFDNADSEFQTEILIELGLQYQFLNLPEKSLNCYARALKVHRNSKTVLRELYSCTERFQKVVEGTKIIEDHLDDHPYDYVAWFYLGNIYALVKTHNKALECYDYSILIKEENPDAFFKKAETLINLERYKDALELLQEELRYREPLAFNYCVIADCYEQLEDFDTAEEYYHKALELDKTYSDAHLGLGFIQEMKFNKSAAIPFYETAIKLDPLNANAHLLLTKILCSQEKFEDAIALIEGFLTKEKGVEEMWINLADIHSKAENFSTALDVIEKGIENAVSNEKLWLKKVVYLQKKGADKEALELMRELLEEDKTIRETIHEFCAGLLNQTAFANLLNQYC